MPVGATPSIPIAHFSALIHASRGFGARRRHDFDPVGVARQYRRGGGLQ